MKILLDNCVDRRFARLIAGHDVKHAREMGWQYLQNGKLLAAAEHAGFAVMITVDKNMEHQQSLAGMQLAVITLAPRFCFYRDIEPMAGRVLELLRDVSPGSFTRIYPGE